MRKYIKRIRTLICCLVICVFALAGSVWATEGDQQRVFDDAGLLTEEQIADLEEQIKAGIEQTGMDLVVVTTAQAMGKIVTAYADDFYDEGGFGTGSDDSGALFLIDMDNRELCISTHGEMIRFLTDMRIEAILDKSYEKVSNEDYYGSAVAFINTTISFVDKGIVAGQYNESTDPKVLRITILELLFALVASGVIAWLPCLSTIRQYKMIKEKKQAAGYNYAYRANCNFAFREKNDKLIKSFVTQKSIPVVQNTKPSGGGSSSVGRSSTHTSSSGRTHGGGRRKF